MFIVNNCCYQCKYTENTAKNQFSRSNAVLMIVKETNLYRYEMAQNYLKGIEE